MTEEKKVSHKPYERHNARQMALQAIYEWQMAKNDVETMIEQFLESNKKKVDLDYFSYLVLGVTNHTKELDDKFSPYISNRTLDQLDQVDKAILRIACYELLFNKQLDYKIAINEAIELAKTYAAEDSHKFVNGVLDKIVKNDLQKKN
ncbi:MAG: transcription antitermination factor NusB [Succinivibrionaceae bacterium]|jgi:N utilization substance protein B|nr:transcription antitermination factor NusB [Succinivibrionaceae bacterium]